MSTATITATLAPAVITARRRDLERAEEALYAAEQRKAPKRTLDALQREIGHAEDAYYTALGV